MTETFLGGRVRVQQPAEGFRGGHDAVFLAAAVRVAQHYRSVDADDMTALRG